MLDWILIALTIALGGGGQDADMAVATVGATAPAAVDEAATEAPATSDEAVGQTAEEPVAATTEDSPEPGAPSVVIGSDVAVGTTVTIGEDPAVSQGMALAEDETAQPAPGGDISLLAGIVEDSDAPAEPAAQTAPQLQAEPQTPTGKFTTATEIKPILDATKSSWLAIGAQPGNDFLYVTHIWSWRCGLLQMRISLNGGAMEVWDLPPCHEDTGAPNAITDSDGLPLQMFGPGEIQSVAVELVLDDLSEMSASYQRNEIVLP